MAYSIDDYINLAKIDLFLPNYRSRKVRLEDLGFSQTDHTHTHEHPGIASYTYIGTTENDPITDPGTGNASVNTATDEYFGMQFVLNLTDKNGLDLRYTFIMLLFFGLFDYYDLFVWVHSKTDPKRYMSFYVFDVSDVTEGEGDDETWVGIAFHAFPVFASMTYDAEADEYTEVTIQDDDEIVVSFDLAFNPDYVGSLGTQDADSVSIYGGTISATNIYGGDIMRLPVKEDTGDPEYGTEGLIYDNTFDKQIRVYTDEAWRTLLDYS